MTSISSVASTKIASSATALKILADLKSNSPATLADKTSVDASFGSPKTVSNRSLDAINQISISNKFSDTAREQLWIEGAKWSYRPERTMPVGKGQDPTSPKDEAFMRSLGADNWVAHYAPKLSKSDFETEALKTLQLNLESSDTKKSYDYYKNAFKDPDTLTALSEDGKVQVSRATLELTVNRYKIEMSVRQALADGSISFSRPEDEQGLDYTGVSYDMYKDGEFHGNYLNYEYNSDFVDNLSKQGIGSYKWGVGLLGFYAKFKMIELNKEGA
ncbi:MULTISPECIES: hypothetical protein [Methylobacterium]|uniref:hypothetical protein n=1 Tax=Methylobacterium TaxID=407 RepID=UPI0008E70673|nr:MULTISPECIES: hypothetical protein [Methylobacterium]MBZ6414979.1 hypothetical protein [Methylobacterium sp.]MBK3400605.1 hypothetical protein [Methylobacterium ajmalii]MBK3408881.1 hypothetical protein [Methylobacterium ajmalii]MBK3422321.1 hypothetical protein [Methylobacterium ajmalii]SFF51919.1 hypothetical protein SAMN04487844_1244 [Methylobacterium sp. yr596]